jgi:hypothetical protein
MLLLRRCTGHAAASGRAATRARQAADVGGLARKTVWVVEPSPAAWLENDSQARSLFYARPEHECLQLAAHESAAQRWVRWSRVKKSVVAAKGSRRFTGESPLLALSARHNVSPRVPRAQALATRRMKMS